VVKKLKDEQIEMIVVNDLLRSGSGFGVDTNAVTIIDRSGKRAEVPTLPKTQVAVAVMMAISDFLKK
jgi:phosphopantothenoylcysteine decarboxylase/phosphopantothenate--cysteine ligase